MPDMPAVIVFDVNETLSDMSVMGGTVRRNRGAALSGQGLVYRGAAGRICNDRGGDTENFAEIATGLLRVSLTGLPLNRGVEAAVKHIMDGFDDLVLHPDIVGGVRDLKAAGFRLVTLSNGSAQVAGKLFDDAGIAEDFEALLSVEDGPAWKPVPEAYRHAARMCGVEPRRLLLVAVHPWDIQGAARTGLRMAWINRSGAPYPSYFTPPEITIGSLRELEPLLRPGS